MVEHVVKKVVVVCLCKSLEQVSVAYVACCQSVAMSFYVGYQVAENFYAVFGYAEILGQGVRCLASGAIVV